MGSLAFDDSMAVGQMLDRRDSAVLDSLCRELLGQDSMDSDSLFRDITLPDVSRPPESTLPQVPTECRRWPSRQSSRCHPRGPGIGDTRRRIITYPGHKVSRVCSSHRCAVMLILSSWCASRACVEDRSAVGAVARPGCPCLWVLSVAYHTFICSNAPLLTRKCRQAASVDSAAKRQHSRPRPRASLPPRQRAAGSRSATSPRRHDAAPTSPLMIIMSALCRPVTPLKGTRCACAVARPARGLGGAILIRDGGGGRIRAAAVRSPAGHHAGRQAGHVAGHHRTARRQQQPDRGPGSAPAAKPAVSLRGVRRGTPPCAAFSPTRVGRRPRLRRRCYCGCRGRPHQAGADAHRQCGLAQTGDPCCWACLLVHITHVSLFVFLLRSRCGFRPARRRRRCTRCRRPCRGRITSSSSPRCRFPCRPPTWQRGRRSSSSC